MTDCDCRPDLDPGIERKTLMMLLLINAVMFLFECGAGLIAESTALLADSLDMLADATVYAIAFYAVGRATQVKIKAARVSSFFQLLLGLGLLVEIVRRFAWGSEPVSLVMIVVGMLALVANVFCLVLIARHRQGAIHMRASWIFSRNDVIANVGVILAGIIVYLTETHWPDLIIGIIIAIVILRGAWQIQVEAKAETSILKNKT